VQYREMTRPDVLAFLDLTDDLGIAVWLDGGWAVDALLGEQTRRHADLDVVVRGADVPALVQHLRLRGFEPVPRDDTSPENFVYGDAHGRDIDVHVVEPGAAEPDSFRAESLTGYGVVGARTVRCVSPAWMVRFHTGYEVDADDWADVSRLCERYGLPVPPDYDRLRGHWPKE
jgi:lincosamide nucleotidyltransferase A/C/D/E